jgi:hypothetical protein
VGRAVRLDVPLGHLGPVLRLVPLGLALVLAGTAAAQPGARQARPEMPRLDGQTGRALPTRGGISLVNVDCPARVGGGTCTGSVRLLPRGAETRALVGKAPVAAARLEPMPSGEDQTVWLKLSSKARGAIRGDGNVLKLTLEIRSGRRLGRRLVYVDDFKPVVGHARPDRVTSGQFKVGGATAQYDTYSWKWDIAVRHFLILPKWNCPSSTPQLASNGNKAIYWNYNERRDLGFQGSLVARAKSGTGYSNFTHANLKQSYDGYRTFWYMTGWEEGGWTTNSVWAPVAFEDGHFELSVTCTDKTDVLGSTAIIYESDKGYLMFPWGS